MKNEKKDIELKLEKKRHSFFSFLACGALVDPTLLNILAAVGSVASILSFIDMISPFLGRKKIGLNIPELNIHEDDLTVEQAKEIIQKLSTQIIKQKKQA